MVNIKLNAFFPVEKKPAEINITYENNRIKQFHILEYLGCYLGANLSGESMAMKSVKSISVTLQFLYRQNEFPNLKLRRLLSNSLINPHFDYTCVSLELARKYVRKYRLLKLNVSIFA